MHSVKLTQQGRDLLVEELKRIARSIGKTTKFWMLFVDKLEQGLAPNLNLKTHYKKPKDLMDIAREIHEFLIPKIPWEKVDKKQRVLYLRLIQIVKKGLDY